MATQTRAPTSDTGTAGAIGYSSGSTAWTLVNDHPDTADPLTTWVEFGTTANSAIWFGFTAFSVPAGSTINSVQVQYYDEEPSNGTNTAAGRLLVGGTHYAASTHNPGTTTTSRTDSWTTNPATSSAWTVDQVNGTGSNNLTGFGVIGPDSNPVWRIGSIQLVVNYTPPVHTTTGTLTADSATVAGTSLHPHTTTGALTAGSATATGSATLTPVAAATVYYVIGPDSGWVNPNATEVKAGQLSGGGPAAASGSEASPVSTTDPLTFAAAATGLDSGTSYRIAFVWSDGTDNSNVDVSGAFSTLATHTTTGALSAQAATLAGTSAHEHAATGALSAQAATAAGTADHRTLHATTGTLTAQAATTAGVAAHEHAATGALSAQAATAAGSAAHLTLHTTTGALSSQSATMTGAAELESDAFDATGALSAQASTVAGTAAHLTLHTTTGVLTGQAATVAGTAAHEHATAGVLTSQAATLAGASAHYTLHATSGALAADVASVSGAAVTGDAFDAVGSLSAQAAAVVGAATRFALHTTSGALLAGSAAASGAAAHQRVATGAIQAGPATVAGNAARLALHATSGALEAGAASVAGAAVRSGAFAAEGAIAAGPATVAGVAARVATHATTGELLAQSAAVAGAAIQIGAGATSPAAVWNYVLSNGLTAEQTLVQLHARMVLNSPPVDVNVQWVNDVEIQGTGAPPDHWRPAT